MIPSPALLTLDVPSRCQHRCLFRTLALQTGRCETVSSNGERGELLFLKDRQEKPEEENDK